MSLFAGLWVGELSYLILLSLSTVAWYITLLNMFEHIFFPHPICCLTCSHLSSFGVRLRRVLIVDDKLILSRGLGVKILFDIPLINAAARLCSELMVSVIRIRR